MELEQVQHWQQRQQRDLALADYMLTGGPEHLHRIREVDAWLLEQAVPDIFDTGDSRNVLTLARQHFLKLCAALTEQGFAAPDKLTLTAFHAAIDYVTARQQSE